MAMAYVGEHGDAAFDGFIGIGMGATDYGQPMRGPFPLATMSVPILDLFGDEDYPAVAEERARAGSPRCARRDTRGPPSASSRAPGTSSATWTTSLSAR